MLDVAIVDLNLSNLHSVNSACKKVGLKSQITSDKKVISKIFRCNEFETDFLKNTR